MRTITFIDTTQPNVLKDALTLVRDVFWEFEAPEYAPEGVSEFCDYIEYDSIARMLEAGELVMLGCFENDKLAGVLALRVPGHISLLFVAKPFHRRGIAKALVATAVRCVQKLSDAAQLTVNSSPYAAGVYTKMDFAKTGEEQTVNGIRFIPMARPLQPQTIPDSPTTQEDPT